MMFLFLQVMFFSKRMVLVLLFSFIQMTALYAYAANDAPHATIRFIGHATLPYGYMFQDTEVGGLSGITYDPAQDVYYTVSDDRSQRQPARFYKLEIDLSGGNLSDESVKVTGVTFLRSESNHFYEQGTVDLEGIVFTKEGYLFVSSEGNGKPFIAKFNKEGNFITTLPVPSKLLPDEGGTKGIRNNFGFESLTISPDGHMLTTAVENALVQDGPLATVKNETLCRLITYDLETESVISEKVYIVDKIFSRGNHQSGRSINGLVELLSYRNDNIYYALERSYSDETGHIVKLYRIDTMHGTDVSSVDRLSNEQYRSAIVPVKKQLILNFNELGIAIDNLEGMTFGPKLPDGTQSLIFISDNNFNPEQVTQFLAFSIGLPE